MKVLFVVYDNAAHISYFPLGMAYLASACRRAGHDVSIYSQDVYHYADEDLTAQLNGHDYDFVGIGACGGYYQYEKVKSLVKAVRASRKKAFLALGGHLVSADPSYFLDKFAPDAICIGEGEITVVDLLDCLARGRSLASVPGLAFKEDGLTVLNERRALIADVDSIEMPAYDLFPIDHYALLSRPRSGPTDRIMAILSGRGCIFNCNFCYRLDQGFRPRSAESILREIAWLMDNYQISYFSFVDELLMSSAERTREICLAFIDSGLSFRWECNGRLNYADSETLRLMRQAGCVFINYGIESLDDRALRVMNKALTVKQIVRGCENTLAAGLSPGLNVIFGNIGEDRDCLRKDVEFLLKYDDHSQLRTIRPVTPYPGSPLYDYAVKEGLLGGCEDFYEVKHRNSDLLTVNFTPLTDDEFHQALYRANKRLLDNHIYFLRAFTEKQLKKLYLEGDASFRGFRHT